MKRNSTPVFAGALLVMVSIMFSACGRGGTDIVAPRVLPAAGSAIFSLAAAPTGTAALRIRVVGPGISNPLARGGARIVFQQTVADTTAFIMAVASNGGAFLEIRVADIQQTPLITVQEVSGGKTMGYQSFPTSAVVVSTIKQ